MRKKTMLLCLLIYCILANVYALDYMNYGSPVKIAGIMLMQDGFGAPTFSVGCNIFNSYNAGAWSGNVNDTASYRAQERANDNVDDATKAIDYLLIQNVQSQTGNIFWSVFDAAFRRHRPIWYVNFTRSFSPYGAGHIYNSLSDACSLKVTFENQYFENYSVYGEYYDNNYGYPMSTSWGNGPYWYSLNNNRMPMQPSAIYKMYLKLNPTTITGNLNDNYLKVVFRYGITNQAPYNTATCNGRPKPGLSDIPPCNYPDGPMQSYIMLIDLARFPGEFAQDVRTGANYVWNSAFLVDGISRAFEKYKYIPEVYFGPDQNSVQANASLTYPTYNGLPKAATSNSNGNRAADLEYDYPNDYVKIITYGGPDMAGYRNDNSKYYVTAHWNY